MSRSVEAIVEASLLVWARESSRLSLDVAAKKAGVKSAVLESWEAGEARPTVAKLRALAKAYKRPLAVFYLAEPPKDFAALRDFRRVAADETSTIITPELAYEIRRAHGRRAIAVELATEIGEDLAVFKPKTNLGEKATVVARRVRRLLGITVEDQLSWSDEYKAFNAWRDALEKLGILVFQSERVKVSEARDDPSPPKVMTPPHPSCKSYIYGGLVVFLCWLFVC